MLLVETARVFWQRKAGPERSERSPCPENVKKSYPDRLPRIADDLSRMSFLPHQMIRECGSHSGVPHTSRFRVPLRNWSLLRRVVM
ncbi:hypothetical protein [Roseomonas sp. BN140053]|uniref:hypothetical protein n=1 Tax=Roseomonas sp. BN140053 TaxID=3391898 RepID=UPI0039E87571